MFTVGDTVRVFNRKGEYVGIDVIKNITPKGIIKLSNQSYHFDTDGYEIIIKKEYFTGKRRISK